MSRSVDSRKCGEQRARASGRGGTAGGRCAGREHGFAGGDVSASVTAPAIRPVKPWFRPDASLGERCQAACGSAVALSDAITRAGVRISFCNIRSLIDVRAANYTDWYEVPVGLKTGRFCLLRERGKCVG